MPDQSQLWEILSDQRGVVVSAWPAATDRLTPEFISRGLESLLGLTPDALMNLDLRELIHPDDRQRFLAERGAALDEAEAPAPTLFRLRGADQSWRWIRESVAVERSDQGAPTRLIAQWEDGAAHQQQQETAERLALVLEGTRLGLWDWYPQTNDVVFDERWAEMLGHDLSEIPFELSSWEARVHPDDLESCYADLSAHMSGERDFYENVHRMRHKDGSWRYILDRGRIVSRNASGEPTRFSGTHTDITAQKEAELAARAATQAKSLFLATMSHEIRTPLHGMLGMLQLLGQSPLSEEQSQSVQIIRQCGDSLLVLLNDLLDFSKAEAGRLTLESAPFHLHEAASGVVDLFSERASAKGVVVRLDYAMGGSRYRLGDEHRFRQVLSNLVSNAIKFTDAGEVRVVVEHGATGVSVAVSDTGKGIEDTSVIWEQFAQEDAAITRQYGGTGLGLSIVKQLVTLMGGSITVQSQPGEGSTFTIDLPLESAPAPAAPVRDADLPQLPGMRVLVAEDNSINQLIARSMLTRWGCEVQVVDTGAQALTACEEHSFDCILMDVHMPVMDGMTAARELQKRGNEVPIIALTADSDADARDACAAAGMGTLVAKPFRAVDLHRALAAVTLS